MGKILGVKQAIKQSYKLKKKGKRVVLVGGVFDILHLGHIKFLEKAKKKGDYLFLLLESDKSVRKLKGPKRPWNNQEDRAAVLAALNSVDFVVMLKNILKNTDYDKIIMLISPDFIATTAQDSYISHKVRQAKLVGAKLKIVTKRLKNKSTSKILKEYG